MSETLFSAVDLFCGGGGFTTGLINALIDHYEEQITDDTGLSDSSISREHPRVQWWLDEHIELTAVNHDDDACRTYRKNHPYATVKNETVQGMHPPDVSDNLPLDLLIAGPSCVPYSRAKGGMASDGQLRHGPQHVERWISLTKPRAFILENVPQFKKWGPLNRDGDKPKMVKDGSKFEAWLESLRIDGYSVDYKTVVASNYGVPQSRKRLFIKGRINYQPSWPVQTHSEHGEKEGTEEYRTAADIIDWDDRGESLFEKNTPLVQNTNRRIAQGIREHGGEMLHPFADALASITKEQMKEMQANAVPVEDAADAAANRDDPFLIEGPAYDPLEDEDTEITALCPPQIMSGCGGGTAKSATDNTTPTVTASGMIHYFHPETFILPRNQRFGGSETNVAYDPEESPLHTVTAKNHDGRKFDLYPCLIPGYSEREGQKPRTRDPSRPLMTVPAKKNPCGISQPFLVKYYGNSNHEQIDNPTPTVTTTNSLSLCVPEMYPFGIDIKYRMLSTKELARAQDFPDTYEFTGDTKATREKQIGNAVPVGLGEAMILPLLEPTQSPTLNNFASSSQKREVPENND
jgi:DNA (cytosine-5)-methyltransferase 1